MGHSTLVSPDQLSVVELSAGEHRVRLALRLTEEFTGGGLVHFSPAATVSIEGMDEISSSYARANWRCGIVSGARYAFRALGLPLQRVVVTELTGRLRACDMEAVARASAIAVAKLSGEELPATSAEGWAMQAEVTTVGQPADERLEAGAMREPLAPHLREKSTHFT